MYFYFILFLHQYISIPFKLVMTYIYSSLIIKFIFFLGGGVRSHKL